MTMARPQNLLAMDAAGASCSVALWAAGRVAVRRFATMARGQSEHLVPMIAEVMGEWGGGLADLDALAVRSEEHTSELQSLMRISYAVFCLKKTQQRILYT